MGLMRGLMLVTGILMSMFLIAFVSGAEDLDMGFEASINGLSTSFSAQTDTGASVGYDGNDLPYSSAPVPSNYSYLWSRICAGNGVTCKVAVDTWPASGNPRKVNLTYTVSPAQTGTLLFEWDFDQDDAYDATFVDYGTSSTFSSSVSSVDMGDENSYEVSISSATTRYVQLVIANDVTVTPSNPGSGVTYTSASQSISFQYSVTAALTPTSCSLVVGGSTLNSSSSISTSSTNTLTYTFTPGSYSWYVSCVDSGGITGQTSTRTFTVATPSTTTDSTSSSSSGATLSSATGVAVIAPGADGQAFLEVPEGLAFSSFVDARTTRSFVVKNLRDTSVTLTLVAQGLADSISLSAPITIAPGAEKEIVVSVQALNAGLLTGKLTLSDGSSSVEIPTVLNVRTENFLFDAGLVLDSDAHHISVGEKLRAQVNLLQVGPQEKVDVVATYIIKDFSGKIYWEESETFYVLNSKEFIKEFDTYSLPPGTYLLGLEIMYPGAFATSSSQFEVISSSLMSTPLLIIGILVVFVGMTLLLVFYSLRRRRLVHHFVHRR